MKLRLAFFITLFAIEGAAQDSLFIKVHFLHGSRPRREYRKVESKWFGGIHGGHVGIELPDGGVLNFVPRGKFHWISNKNRRHSAFVLHHRSAFNSILSAADSARRTIIRIPITQGQQMKLDSIASAYTSQVPYDYAFLGMRCASATYDVLSQLEVVKPLGRLRMTFKIFYPKKLRKPLTKLARKNNWQIERTEGSSRRVWESE